MSCFGCFNKPAANTRDVKQLQLPSEPSTYVDEDDGQKEGRQRPVSAELQSTRTSFGHSNKQHPKVAESLEALQQAGLPLHIDVSWCEPAELVKDVHNLRWVGQGSQGVVYEGIWQGAMVAVKWSIAEQLDTGACELLFSRLLGHPNVVQTYNAKVAILDAQVFERDSPREVCSPAIRATSFDMESQHESELADGGQFVRADSFKSEEGFGNPFGRNSGFTDVRDMLRLIGAKPGQCITQMIMEYCDQGSLLTAISRGIFLPNNRFGHKVALRALFRTAREICQGMVHLHQAHVVHGDLKPANVLLMNSRKDRRGFIAKISDFGLAQYCPAAHGVVENAPWGTLVFMAPERFNSNRLEPASDVWSLGVIMWQMYTARLPYEGATQAKLLQGISQGTLHLTWPPGSPLSLVNLVSCCMARQPSTRPTFESLIHRLANLENEVRMEGIRLSNSMDAPSRSVSTDRHPSLGEGPALQRQPTRAKLSQVVLSSSAVAPGHSAQVGVEKAGAGTQSPCTTGGGVTPVSPTSSVPCTTGQSTRSASMHSSATNVQTGMPPQRGAGATSASTSLPTTPRSPQSRLRVYATAMSSAMLSASTSITTSADIVTMSVGGSTPGNSMPTSYQMGQPGSTADRSTLAFNGAITESAGGSVSLDFTLHTCSNSMSTDSDKAAMQDGALASEVSSPTRRVDAPGDPEAVGSWSAATAAMPSTFAMPHQQNWGASAQSRRSQVMSRLRFASQEPGGQFKL